MDLPGNAALREFMDELTSTTHVSKYVELPMICVMGDTSSGKSSLLSAISMVELPSSSQLTTKCPILLHMRRSSERGAKISIQWREDNEEVDFPERCIDENNWDTLATVIQEAQHFILEKTAKQVASDVVHVHVHGPDCPDLTLIDLPGLVKSRANQESESLVEDVDLLIKEYLKNERCVILAVVPANVDFHNSQILAHAQVVDPSTRRTIPVITKPDLIDEGAEQDVLDLLLGKKISFTMGFHMVKCRGQAMLDRKDSLETGLESELQYFDETDPWKSVEDRNLFGIVHLRKKLGDLQMSMVRETIPTILKEIRLKQQHAFDALVDMGNLHLTMTDKRRYYQDFCNIFLKNLKASLTGKGGRVGPSAAAKLHDACNQFMNSIKEGSLGTIQNIVEGSMVIVTTARGSVRGEVVHVEKQYACVDYVEKDDRTTEALFDYIGYKSQETIEKDDVWSDGNKVYIARENNVFDLLKKISLDRIRTDPSWLTDKIAENRTDDLACFLNVDIFKNIVADFIDVEWSPHCTSLVNELSEILHHSITEALDRTSTSNRYPKLRTMIKTHSDRTANSLILQARKQVESHLNIEKHPYTQDDVLFANIAEARHRGLKRELEVALRLDQEGAYDTGAIKAIMEGVFERNQRKSVEEHMAEDMEIVLEAYGQVATKRVIDRTPMICWEVIRSLTSSIQETLWNATDDTLAESMKDTPEFAERYKTMTEELEEMNKALSIFQSLV